MPTPLSFRLGASLREGLTLRMSTNPFGATGGPMPRVTIPLEARVAEHRVELDILRLSFDLKLGNTVLMTL